MLGYAVEDLERVKDRAARLPGQVYEAQNGSFRHGP